MLEKSADVAVSLSVFLATFSLVVGRSVGLSVVRLCEKVTFRVSDGN